MSSQTATQRKLTMRFAGGLVKHLGLQMYSGAVPAIAELVKNAYDAGATVVDIQIPLDRAWEDDDLVLVKDNGHGMGFDDCERKYLVIGRDRRADIGDLVEGNERRRPLGRKGLGKLAGFGIARILEVKTVRDGHLTHFKMDYAAIERKHLGDPYEPQIEADRQAPEGALPGTMVILRQVKLRRAINGDDFRRSMAKRFALLSDDFQVKINGDPIRRSEYEFQFRFPGEGWQVDHITGCGNVKWWAGFTETPIEIDEERGFVVLARGALAQTPFFFNLSGGLTGQHGMQYLTGEVIADFLDESTDAIATDRSSINWELEETKPLLKWGQDKIKWLLREWSKLRQEAKEEYLRRETKYYELIESFPEAQRAELTNAITKLSSITTIEDERLDELVQFLIEAYQRADVMKVIRQLMAASVEEQAQVLKALEEWDVIEAVSFAQIVKGRLAVIKKFDELIKASTPEKVPDREDMQGFLELYPWLIDARWALAYHEKELDTVLIKHFKIDQSETEGDDERIDFFCLKDGNHVIVVEVKGAGVPAGRREFGQIARYVDFFRDRVSKHSNDPEIPYTQVSGYLVAKHVTPEAKREELRLQSDGVFFRSWQTLVDMAKEAHKEYYDLIRKRVRDNDPRIKALEEVNDILPDDEAYNEDGNEDGHTQASDGD